MVSRTEFAWRRIAESRWTYDSYVNPNARCPVCGAQVFFYQSPYGGRVFFDDLGPPWPKHPCTSQGYAPLLWSDEETEVVPRAMPQWKSGEWQPFILHTEELCFDSSRANYVEISGTPGNGDGQITLYSAEAIGEAPLQVRPKSNNTYELASISLLGGEVRERLTVLYRNLEDLLVVLRYKR